MGFMVPIHSVGQYSFSELFKLHIMCRFIPWQTDKDKYYNFKTVYEVSYIFMKKIFGIFVYYAYFMSHGGPFRLIKSCKCGSHGSLKIIYCNQNFTKSLFNTLQNAEKCLCFTQSLIIVLQNFETLIRMY